MHSSIAFIHQIPLFSTVYLGNLAADEQMKIVANSHHLEYQHADVMVEMGRKAAERYLFIVESGTVRVVRNGIVLEEVGPGGFVGEKTILLDETPGASVIAEGVCKVFRLPETVLSSLPEDVLNELKQKAASRFV
jgi:CRP-like cAMP-binding protein